ncbi:MAG: DNA polymerase III subunit gamma/tau [Candidatus Cryptobacteroides sp.]
MSQYIVSARKYRPDSFESLVGQENIVRTLKNSIARGQLAHAYLFCGPRGVGKTSAARIFAKTINCSDLSPEMEPCGKCESCVSFREGRSYCIHELDAASNNGVEDIKALIDQVNVPPQVGRYSVFIIDEVHMLTQSAFNAFLKTLEEPPSHAIFILATTEKHKILPTILSRCQTYDFNRISIPDIVGNLRSIASREGITVDDESLHVIAQKADGAMRDALTIFDQTVAFCGTDIRYEDVLKNLNVLSYEHSFALVDSFLKGDYGAALLKFDEILAKGFNALHFVSALSQHLRDLIVARTGGLDALLELPKSLKERYAAQAGSCTLQFLYDALSITTACEAGYKAAVNPRLHVEFALMKLSFLSGNGGVSLRPAAPATTASGKSPATTGVSASGTPPRAMGASAGKPADAAPAAAGAGPASPEAEASAAPSPQAAAAATTIPAEGVSLPASSSAAAPGVTAATPGATGTGAAAASSEASPAASSAPGVTSASGAASPAPSRRRPARTPSSLSISSLESDDASDAGSTASQADSTADILASDEAIMEAWKKLPQANANRPRLSKMLSTAKVSITLRDDVKVVDFCVINASQKQWVEENLLRQLESQLVQFAGSGKIRLSVSVLPEEKVEAKPYMPEEKAIELMKTNPEVKNFVQDFDLDTK